MKAFACVDSITINVNGFVWQRDLLMVYFLSFSFRLTNENKTKQKKNLSKAANALKIVEMEIGVPECYKTHNDV